MEPATVSRASKPFPFYDRQDDASEISSKLYPDLPPNEYGCVDLLFEIARVVFLRFPLEVYEQ